MAKKKCGYDQQVANGARAGLTGFVIGAAIRAFTRMRKATKPKARKGK